jgi:hypothetical protein
MSKLTRNENEGLKLADSNGAQLYVMRSGSSKLTNFSLSGFERQGVVLSDEAVRAFASALLTLVRKKRK